MASTCRIQPDRFCSTTKPRRQAAIAIASEGWPKEGSAEATHQWFAQEAAEMRAQRREAKKVRARALQLRTMANNQTRKLWDSLHSSYWFIPTLMALVVIALAFMTLTLDRAGKWAD